MKVGTNIGKQLVRAGRVAICGNENHAECRHGDARDAERQSSLANLLFIITST